MPGLCIVQGWQPLVRLVSPEKNPERPQTPQNNNYWLFQLLNRGTQPNQTPANSALQKGVGAPMKGFQRRYKCVPFQQPEPSWDFLSHLNRSASTPKATGSPSPLVCWVCFFPFPQVHCSSSAQLLHFRQINTPFC